jgi:hypothetical protein
VVHVWGVWCGVWGVGCGVLGAGANPDKPKHPNSVTLVGESCLTLACGESSCAAAGEVKGAI